MFGKPFRNVIWQCKKCRRCFGIAMYNDTKNPKCPDCKGECVYVIAT